MAQFPHSKLHRRPWDTGLTPFRRATTYQKIKNGTYPPAVKIGRMSAWLDREMAAVTESLIQGQSDDEIRQLVKDLVSRRTAGAGQ